MNKLPKLAIMGMILSLAFSVVLGKVIKRTGEVRQQATGNRQQGNAQTSSYDHFKYNPSPDNFQFFGLSSPLCSSMIVQRRPFEPTNQCLFPPSLRLP